MLPQSSEWIETRLFRPKIATAKVSDRGLKRGSFRNMSEKALFGKTGPEYLGEPPTNSLYDITLHESVSDLSSVSSGWITVYGNSTISKNELIHYFIKYGEIISVEYQACNWISLEFSKRTEAERAVKENSKPILIYGRSAVFARMGRHQANKENEEQEEIQELDTLESTEELSLLTQIQLFLESLLYMFI
ncbi:hypothetical protein TVAG_486060 [Trichomonas vaginalis G3]|uniref:RRM Nup35-type domain-containing protein n=1 Tax=Trichomonas vaginalis (strain ATCC PRA-98 / G3) TaxID=412133 RepID=A2EEF3_TRIV3|nr:RRM Nup53 like domain-containing protein [Trichomonas vaginalis G3]EAY08959.1 hypothetical protein TVAG_486060 [Trichomonas vaginalis G3]KAI5508592.1 RRM Nup53 like domain-containing protein [Trichomonas vaginalis G3]|eukprot:XP_001321182.1 hypothetical protein [Trichomonas vaginalis G3]